MNERIYRGSRDLWLPGIVIGVGWLVSGWIFWSLISDRRAQLVEAAEEVTRNTEQAIAQRLESQMDALQGLANLWTRFGLRPLPEWRADADLLIDTRNGLTSVAWVDRNHPERRVAVGEDRSPEAVEIDEKEALRHFQRQHVEGPERSATGALEYRVFLPVQAAADRAGMLVAHVAIDDLLRPLLQSRARGYALTVTWNDEAIFEHGSVLPEDQLDWWRAEGTVRLPYGGEWRVVHRPSPELAADRLTFVPHYLLAAGMVLALLLGATVHQWRVMARQARFLGIANRTLEAEGQDLERLNSVLEQRVADRTERLEEAIAELEAFNHSVSHDLRSPLAAVLNFAAILEEDYRDVPLDAEGVELIGRIQRSTTRATALLDGLLQLSSAGQASLDLDDVDMTVLARETFVQALAADRGTEVEFVLTPLPSVRGDRALLGSVFANLFTNALKYSRGCEKRRVSVSGTIEGGECIFEVTDNGRGFDMRFASKLFQLFERLHSDAEVEGTGVGLAMVARIVKRHGGRVWGRGESDRGATFGFSLPRPGVDA